jgi:hypothetical protein
MHWTLIFFAFTLSAQAAPAHQIPRCEVFEAQLESAANYANPFTDVAVTAQFTAPSGKKLTAPGFHDGGNTWRVRLAPDETGDWSFRTTCSDPGNAGLHQHSGSFKCVASSNKGFIRVDPVRKYRFSFEDGTRFFGMGDTCYGLANGISDRQRIAYLDTRAAQKFNFVRFFASGYMSATGAADAWPWGGTPMAPDYDRLNPQYFRKLESILGELKARGMHAELEVFNYYTAPFCNTNIWNASRDGLWGRYVVSRLAAYTTVFLWTVANEYEVYPTSKYAYSPEQDDSWVRRMGALIHAADPQRHPTTVHPWERTIMIYRRLMGPRFGHSPDIDVLTHQHYGWFDFNRKTMTHEAPQSRWMSEGMDVDQWADRVYDKPVINTESGYEDNPSVTNRDAYFSTEKCRSAAWRVFIGGGAAYAAGFKGTWGGIDTPSQPFVVSDNGLARQLGYYYDFIQRTDFQVLNPVHDVVYRPKVSSNVYVVNTPNLCLANPGREYVVYAADGGTVTLDLASAKGTFEVEWLDPRSGEYHKRESVAGGAYRSFGAPGTNDWVLHLKQ